MSEETYRIAPNVICCPSRNGVVEDKQKDYTKADFGNGDEAEEHVKDGFLIKNKVKKEKTEK